ncbi:MAG: Rieske (2Fe-2S) protein [Sandaracinus sp.]
MADERDESRALQAPISRRAMLISLPVIAAGASMLQGCGASIPGQAVVYGAPDTLTAGTPTRLGSYDVFLVRTEQGIAAISGRCTHLGCGVAPTAEGAFHCGCHGSEFAADGTVTHGPAGDDLAWFAVRIENGSVVVDPSQRVAKGTYTPLEASSGGEVAASSDPAT